MRDDFYQAIPGVLSHAPTRMDIFASGNSGGAFWHRRPESTSSISSRQSDGPFGRGSPESTPNLRNQKDSVSRWRDGPESILKLRSKKNGANSGASFAIPSAQSAGGSDERD
ncbi:MAG: hypothetical protein NTX50_20790 [Candidatus Sumerlaeota bacterium]|nr:hypothetical protein [Candidatus Sumerlaeota bacterium]